MNSLDVSFFIISSIIRLGKSAVCNNFQQFYILGHPNLDKKIVYSCNKIPKFWSKTCTVATHWWQPKFRNGRLLLFENDTLYNIYTYPYIERKMTIEEAYFQSEFFYFSKFQFCCFWTNTEDNKRHPCWDKLLRQAFGYNYIHIHAYNKNNKIHIRYNFKINQVINNVKKTIIMINSFRNKE